jgi:hypothetical protein
MKREITEMRVVYNRAQGILEIYDDYEFVIKNGIRPIEIRIQTLRELGVDKSCEFIGQKFVGMLSELLSDIKQK